MNHLWACLYKAEKIYAPSVWLLSSPDDDGDDDATACQIEQRRKVRVRHNPNKAAIMER